MFQHGCMCHSSSTPNICTHVGGKVKFNPSHKQDTMEQQMEEGDHTHSHTHSQEAMPLQDRACPAPQHMHHHQQQPLPTLSGTTATDMPPTDPQGTASPPSHLTAAPLPPSTFPSPPLAHSTLLGVEPQLLDPLEEEEDPMPEIKPPQHPLALKLASQHQVTP